MNIDLKGKTALVCGASQGLGRAISFQLAESGASVISVARNEILLKELIESLPKGQVQKHGYISADFSTPEIAVEVILSALKEYSSADILINNSGGPSPGKAIDASIDDFKSAFSSHLIMSQLLTQALVPAMKKKSFGRIINIISMSVRQPVDGLGVSNTIRGAMASWSKTLSRELAIFGITVNNILPGPIATDRLRALLENRAKVNQTSYEVEKMKMESEIPVNRFGRPEELAYMAAFLASEQASFITGTNIPVDGGMIKSI